MEEENNEPMYYPYEGGGVLLDLEGPSQMDDLGVAQTPEEAYVLKQNHIVFGKE